MRVIASIIISIAIGLLATSCGGGKSVVDHRIPEIMPPPANIDTPAATVATVSAAAAATGRHIEAIGTANAGIGQAVASPPPGSEPLAATIRPMQQQIAVEAGAGRQSIETLSNSISALQQQLSDAKSQSAASEKAYRDELQKAAAAGEAKLIQEQKAHTAEMIKLKAEAENSLAKEKAAKEDAIKSLEAATGKTWTMLLSCGGIMLVVGIGLSAAAKYFGFSIRAPALLAGCGLAILILAMALPRVTKAASQVIAWSLYGFFALLFCALLVLGIEFFRRGGFKRIADELAESFQQVVAPAGVVGEREAGIANGVQSPETKAYVDAWQKIKGVRKDVPA